MAWECIDVGFFKCFSAEASAGISNKKGLHAGLVASILSADITFSPGALEVGLQGYLGGAGFNGFVNTDGFSWSYVNAVG